MTARNDDGRRDADYDGMDALMAALVDDPLPEGARHDASFMAAHRAAAADVALLREQLLLIGETLARDTGAAVGAADAEPVAGAQVPGGAGGSAGRVPVVGSAAGHAAGPGTASDLMASTPEPEAGATGAGTESGAQVRAQAGDPAGRIPVVGSADGLSSTRAAADPTASRAGQEAGAGAGVVSPAGRRSRPRPLVLALRGLAAAVAAGFVVGMGWLVVQGDHGSADDAAGSSAADSAAGSRQGDQESALSHAGYLACARLVAEGTVAEVEPVPGTGQDRVTLDVDRYYKPAKGQDRIAFPMAEDAVPRPRPGDRVLVGITRGQAQPDLWSVGEKAIAPERVWITAAPAESGTRPCE
ncbi:hypothetical protein [Streptomyces coeruleorubidus]|uniref:hypothetical protein n=1 Tax=Streptomyces coeruleorubidus TaxID=116188 RepID=UPI0034086F77